MESRVEEFLKVEEQMKVQDQSKAITGPTGIPRRRKRMTNVLEAILRPAKMVPPAAPKISEDTIHEPKMAIVVEIAHGSGASDPLGSVSTKIMPENLPGKENLPRTKTPSVEDIEYIVRHASRKKLSREEIACNTLNLANANNPI
jgi:hypothetical protein